MTLEQVLQLGKMGYTKEEIEQLETGKPQEANDSGPIAGNEPETPPEAAPEAPAEPAKDESPAEDKAPDLDAETMKRLDGMEAQLTKILRAIQASNLKKDSFGGPTEDIDAAADKALASLVTAGIERKE